jgi:hypothetical protein
VEAKVRSLEEVEAALQIAGDKKGFREMKLLVRIQDGDVDGLEASFYRLHNPSPKRQLILLLRAPHQSF